MRTAYALSLAALGQLVAGQAFNPQAVNAASPASSGPAAKPTTSTYSYSVNPSSASSSISAKVTKASSAAAAPTSGPSNQKRWGGGGSNAPSYGGSSGGAPSYGGGSSGGAPSYSGGSSGGAPSYGGGSSGGAPSYGGGSSGGSPSWGGGSSGGGSGGAPSYGGGNGGPPSNGPPSNGPPSNGPPSNGPPSNGPPSNGPPSNGPPSHGPPSNGPPSNGPPSNGPPSNGPPSNGPPGPPGHGPPSNGPPGPPGGPSGPPGPPGGPSGPPGPPGGPSGPPGPPGHGPPPPPNTWTTSITSTYTSPITTSTTVSSATTPYTTGTSTTTSSESACPTTPEKGTYCGFINPEDPCAPQPSSAGGVNVTPDTVQNFLNYPEFKAESYDAITPFGYEEVFTDLTGSISGGSYITYKLLDTYNVSACANFCDNTDLCTAFNIYIERDPTQNPSYPNNTAPTIWGNDCPNPKSVSNYYCSLWGSSISSAMATNQGQSRDEFQVVITGSNGYDKTNNTVPDNCPGYKPPTTCGGKAINQGGQWNFGSQFFPGPFNPSLCAIFAEAQVAINMETAKKSGSHSYTPCNMFNAYYVFKEEIAVGTYCSLFDTVLNSTYAQWEGANIGGVDYSCGESWSYELSVFDEGTW